MKNEYDALNRATVRPEEYAPVPLGEAQQAAQFRRLLAAASAQADGGAAAGTPRRRTRGRKRMAALLGTGLLRPGGRGGGRLCMGRRFCSLSGL